MKKPDTCKGCPLYDDGEGFVPDELIAGALTQVWLQNPGDGEERKAKPAVGATGDDLDRKWLPRAGLTRSVNTSVCNAFRCRWRDPKTGKKVNKLPPPAILSAALKHCRQYDDVQGLSKIIAAGAVAWRALGQAFAITDWRGFVGPKLFNGASVFGTLHPADLFRAPKNALPVSVDWAKIGRWLDDKWPLAVPPFERIPKTADPSILLPWVEEAAARAPFVVIDTEYARGSRYLLMIGLGYPGMPHGIQVAVNTLSPVGRSMLRNALLVLVAACPIVFQNAMADVPVLRDNLGIQYADYRAIDDTMLMHALLWSDWPHTLEFLASLYGSYPKMKHLAKVDPELYNWGDVIDTIAVYEGLVKELRHDAPSAAIYRAQSLPLVPIILRRAQRGLRVNRGLVTEKTRLYETKKTVASQIAQACMGRPFNVGSDDQLKAALYKERGYQTQINRDTKSATVDGDAIAELRKAIDPIPDFEEEEKNGLSVDEALSRIGQGADPLLEARVIYAGAQQILTHYLAPRDAERIYPSMKLHAQASGRWSITEPPLQQDPSELKGTLIPDEGMSFVGWDWDQIELRILAALAKDAAYLEAFERDWDVHTLNACDIFDLPKPTERRDPTKDAEWVKVVGWAGKEDIRRTFAKRFVYRLNYGGDPHGAGDIPGARQLGLDGPQLVEASRRYLAAHPAMASWRVATAAQAHTTRQSRTFMGRLRRLEGNKGAIERAAFNHPMQGAVADILNIVVVQIAGACPYAILAWTVHDAAWFEVPTEMVEDFQRAAYPIITQAWDVYGTKLAVPAKWKEVVTA